MSLYRWSLGLLRLGALLLAVGVLPELIALALGASPALTAMLVLTVAPLGVLVTAIALVMLAVALIRRYLDR